MKFNIKAILTAAATVAGTLNPGVGAAIGLINQLLPQEKQLPITATGQDCEAAIKSLPADQQANIYNHEIDLELAKVESHAAIQATLAQVDATGNTTRPKIALMMARAIILTVVPVAWCLSYALVMGEVEMIKAIADNYLIILALLALPAQLVKSYFGHRTDEKKTRYSLAHGQPLLPQPLGLIGKLLK